MYSRNRYCKAFKWLKPHSSRRSVEFAIKKGRRYVATMHLQRSSGGGHEYIKDCPKREPSLALTYTRQSAPTADEPRTPPIASLPTQGMPSQDCDANDAKGYAKIELLSIVATPRGF